MESTITKTSERLKLLMEENHMNQTDVIEKLKPLCERYGIKFYKSSLSQYVNGRAIPDQDKAYLLAQIFDVSPAWIMGFDVERKVIPTTPESIEDQKVIAINWLTNHATREEKIEILKLLAKDM